MSRFAATVALGPLGAPVPFLWLAERWSELGLEPGPCRLVLEEAIDSGTIPAGLLSPEQVTLGGVVASPELLFDYFASDREWGWQVVRPGSRRGFSGTLRTDQVQSAAGLLRRVFRASAFSEIASPPRVARLVEETLAASYIDAEPDGVWPIPTVPGIYRREHASLVIRTEQSTIVTDPKGMSADWTTNDGHCPAQPAGTRFDAIAITHGHDDHWHLPTILALADDDTVVIAPRIPRTTLLAPEDFAESLALVGQRASAPDWYSTIVVGDIEVDVLPFYGEQPTREPPAPQGLRNWGNTYRFNCPGFSVLILVDSGTDPEGSAIDAIERSVAERGPVDVVLSCCLRFGQGVNLGLPHYAFTLPFSRLREIGRQQVAGAALPITLGPEGVADACAAAQARYYLPYAHGFAGIGVDPRYEGEGELESTVMEEVSGALSSRSPTTEIIAWHPGDAFVEQDGHMTLRRSSQSTPQ